MGIRVMKRIFTNILLASAITVGTYGVAAADQSISLRSGNGAVGGPDSFISFLLGPIDSGFAAPFTMMDFANARSGPQASIINRNAAWVVPTAVDPAAQWISDNPNGAVQGFTALYAIDFTITDAVIASASIGLNFAVDNVLGDANNPGVFLNGTALSGNTNFGGFGGVFNITRTDIGPLLTTGLNTLYINARDVGGPGGLVFSGTIRTIAGTPPPPSNRIPEPGMLALFGLAIAGVGFTARRKRKRA